MFDQLAAISRPLLEWFRTHQRDLPWRREATPYSVWVSEVMLQQTQVATVVPYFVRWMARFPTIEALAAAEEADVLHAWQGLGYYSRARNLLCGARDVVRLHAGRVPSEPQALRALPGVGAYTAGAVASIAYNIPVPIVDGNVVRVLTRLYGLRGDPGRAPLRGELWELAAQLIPPDQAGNFNPALMELGATICMPHNPRCDACPVGAACEARRLGMQAELPETPPRPKITHVRMAAAVIRRGGRLLVAQRSQCEKRWAGMWQFPAEEAGPGEAAVDAARRAAREAVGLEVTAGPTAALVRHSVTRYRITLEAVYCDAAGEPETRGCPAWAWASPRELEEYALPAAHRRIARRIEAGEAECEARR